MADYLESVRRAGGEPFELEYQRDDPREVVRRANGLMLTGGGDVDPALYGESPHPTYQASEPGRDDYEIALIKAAAQAGLPIFAICRGMQVLNVALGGTLIQDIPSMVNGAVNHAVPEPRFAIAHEVWVATGSKPGDVFRLAVQWHPENFWRTGEFRPLFEGFVEAVRKVTR